MFFDDFSDFTNKEILVSIDDNRCVPLRAFNYDENKFINTIYHYLFIDLQHNKKTVFSYFDKFIKSGKFSLDDYNLKNVSFGDKGNYEHIDNYICIDILFEYCKKNPKDFMQSYLEHKLDNDYSNTLNKVLTLKELPTMETDVEIRKYFKNSNMTLSKSYDFVYLLWVNDVDCPFLYQFLSESPLRYIDPKEIIYEFYDIIGDNYDSATIIKKRINIIRKENKKLH